MYSDHLAFTASRDRSLGHLAPNLFDDDLLDRACRHVELMAEVTGRRVCLENLATKTTITGSKYTPEEFYLRLIEKSDAWDCHIDLTNIWINSQNRPVDAVEFVRSIPRERIRYVHLAGGRWIHDELVDSHSEAVHPEAFELLGLLLEISEPEAVMVERDSIGSTRIGRYRPTSRRRAGSWRNPDSARGRRLGRPERRRLDPSMEGVVQSVDGERSVRARAARSEPLRARTRRATTPRASFVSEGYQAVRDTGYHLLAVPQDLGGHGHGLLGVCRRQAAIGRECASTSLAIGMHQHATMTLAWRRSKGDEEAEHARCGWSWTRA